MSLNAKKILEHIFWKFYMWKISILENFSVFRPLLRQRRLQWRGIIFLLFYSHFDRLLLQLQTLQVSEVVLVQKYFLNRPWSQKNLMSSWGEGCVGAPLQHPLQVFCSLAPLLQCLYFSLSTHLKEISTTEGSWPAAPLPAPPPRIATATVPRSCHVGRPQGPPSHIIEPAAKAPLQLLLNNISLHLKFFFLDP